MQAYNGDNEGQGDQDRTIFVYDETGRSIQPIPLAALDPTRTRQSINPARSFTGASSFASVDGPSVQSPDENDEHRPLLITPDTGSTPHTSSIARAVTETSTHGETEAADEPTPNLLLEVQYLPFDLVRDRWPKLDPNSPAARPRRRTDRDIALLIQLALATTTLCFNLGISIYGPVRYGSQGGFGDIFTGSCASASNLNTGLHLLINVLSTMLLSASNYCAQILSSPTRDEVDTAHKKHEWLDIGVPTLRNLSKKRIASHRKTGWFLLLSSSGLLHLTWNSAVFVTTPRNDYTVAVVTQDFASDPNLWQTNSTNIYDLQQSILSSSMTNLRYMTAADCIANYTALSDALGDLVVVASNVTTDMGVVITSPDSNWNVTNTSLINSFSISQNHVPGTYWIYGHFWLCSATVSPGQGWCDATIVAKEPQWTLRLGPPNVSHWIGVDHCLAAGAEPWANECTVRYSLGILVITCILNLIKTLCVIYTWLFVRTGKIGRRKSSDREMKRNVSLVTIGDAVATFLEEPDDCTTGMQLASKTDFEGANWEKNEAEGLVAERYRRLLAPRRWYQAASARRWVFTYAACVATILIATVLLGLGFRIQQSYNIPLDLVSLWHAGLGTAQPYATTLTSAIHSTFPDRLQFWVAVLISNFPQLLLSALYLLINGLVATMAVSNEFNDYVRERKTLRLTSPHGMQRSSYFLALPYRFSIPLMCVGGLLHWLISQSLFVIDIRGFKYAGTLQPNRYIPDPSFSSTVIGYSIIGIILTLTVACFFLLQIVYMGFFRFRGEVISGSGMGPDHEIQMPLASTCSAAISAACHRPAEDTVAHLGPVRWGRVRGTGLWCFSTARKIELTLRDEASKKATAVSENEMKASGYGRIDPLRGYHDLLDPSQPNLNPNQRNNTPISTMSAPNAGRQSPDPERQGKSQLQEPPATNVNDQTKEVSADQNKDALKGLESNPRGPLEDAAEEKTKKTVDPKA